MSQISGVEYAHKLFGVIQRLHGADEFERTGIGLAIVRRVIARARWTEWANRAHPGWPYLSLQWPDM